MAKLILIFLNFFILSLVQSLSKHPIILVVSFDGFRYDYPDKVFMPTLRQIQSEGVSVPRMQPQFPTKTFPNHQSIATGLYPDVHGVIDNSLFDPLLDKGLSGRTDEEFWWFSSNVVPIWILNEKAGDQRYSGCYMWPGSDTKYGSSKSHVPDHLKTYDSTPWEERVSTVISWITGDYKPANMVFLYYNLPDSKQHSVGADAPEVLAEIKKIDDNLLYLVNSLKKEGIYDKVNLVILSDHGMQTVNKKNGIYLGDLISEDLYYKNGASPILNIQPKRRDDAQKIYDAFRKEAGDGTKFQVFWKSQFEQKTGLHYGSNRRIMDIILLAQPGYYFDDNNYSGTGSFGVHGYDNRNLNMSAFFTARGPSFKRGYKHGNVIQNIDLFSLFSKIVDIPTAKNNGSFSDVSQFLK